MKNINNKLSDISALTVNGESQLIGPLTVLSQGTIGFRKQISGVDNSSISIASNGDILITNKTVQTHTVNNGLANTSIVQDSTDVTVTAENINLYSSANIEIDASAGAVLIASLALYLSNLPIYANNAAALAGSLIPTQVYSTATGELRIVV